MKSWMTLCFFLSSLPLFAQIQIGRMDALDDPLTQSQYLLKETLQIDRPEKLVYRPRHKTNLIRLEFSLHPVTINTLRLTLLNGENITIDLLKGLQTNSRPGDKDTFFIQLEGHNDIEKLELHMQSHQKAKLQIDFLQTPEPVDFYTSF